jgi:flagellin-specific chaperone FliS
MGIGIISPIKKDYSGSKDKFMQTLQENGFTRTPGTGETRVPYKERNGKYRTGIDPEAAWIQDLPPEEREIEIARAKKELAELQKIYSGVDLGPRSKFWNFTATDEKGNPLEQQVMPVRLQDMDNEFDLDVPERRIAYNWLRVHPMIARSFSDWEKGKCLPDVAFYVKDQDVEADLSYKKRKTINDAKKELSNMTPSKMRRAARLLGQAVNDDTKEEIVYNILDEKLSKSEGAKQFMDVINLREDIIHVKDIIHQALENGVIRTDRGGKIYEGEAQLGSSESDYLNYLLEPKNQEDLLALEKKVNSKRSVFI